jgi:phosphoribosylanthranilate isomerase
VTIETLTPEPFAPSPLRVKICGITRPEQGQAIAQLGATALGFICTDLSPRYVTPSQIQAIANSLPLNRPDLIGVFVNASADDIERIVTDTRLTGVQLHGDESPTFCQELRQRLPGIELLKAFRVRDTATLDRLAAYTEAIDTLLLDAYHPQQLGGTGLTLDRAILAQFRPQKPWFLAGGLTPDTIREALSQVQPSGIDLSSGVERSPGDKDLARVAQLFAALKGRSIAES